MGSEFVRYKTTVYLSYNDKGGALLLFLKPFRGFVWPLDKTVAG